MEDYSNRENRNRFYKSSQWQQLRRKALERDHYECLWCKEQGKVTTATDDVLEVDHILTLEEHPEHRLELDNLRTLCRTCHNKRHQRFQFGSESGELKKDYRTDEWFGTPPTEKNRAT